MLPKRKLIKKRHRRPEQDAQNPNMQPTSLIQKLRSVDGTHVEEALAFVASMCALPQAPEDVVLIVEMLSILQKGTNSVIYGCLYGLANLIEINPKIVPKLFQLGLDKALIQLNSSDKDLLKPIIELMTVLHSYLPEQYKYLEKGVQQSLTIDHLISNNKLQVLQFLMRVESGALREEIYEKIYQLFKNQEKLHIRALCGSILMQNSLVRQKISKQLLQFCDEVIGDIDLQKQYKTNIISPKMLQKAKQNQTDMMQQEQEVMPVAVEDTHYHTFTDAVAAVETYLEAILILFQENAQEDIQEEEIEDQNQGMQNAVNEAESEVSQGLAIAFVYYFANKPMSITKNTMLSFLEGQNIVHLSLRILSYCKSIPKPDLALTVLKCLQNSIMVQPPQEIFQQTLLVGLHLLMNSQIPKQARTFLLTIGENVLKIKDTYKDIWVCLLQIISKQFNPEKYQVLVEQNQRAGAILKNLLINIPHLTLEEWRAQTIDTIFDVFSNEQFDTYLVHLGLLPLLKEVLIRVSNQKKKRFLRQVLSDIKRFLEYKSKRIHF